MKNIFKLSQKTIKSREFLGESIEVINSDVVILAKNSKYKENYFLGVKNNKNIDRELLKKICTDNEFIWHTIDRGSDRGRAIDIRLKNPITGNPMTGSSSGTAINVLYGINDLGIGTDGGGSVIYPAIVLNLYSFMGKGMGLCGKHHKKSTEGIEFASGIGFISHDFSVIKKAIEKLDFRKEKEKTIKKIKVGTLGIDKIENKELFEKVKINFGGKEINIKNSLSDDRYELMSTLDGVFKEKDIIIAYEKDIEIDGLGDSVYGVLGCKSRERQKRSNKILGKVANMMNLTVITIPDKRLSSAVFIIAKEGINYGLEAIEIASKIDGKYMPELYYSYFKNSYLKSNNEMIFDL